MHRDLPTTTQHSPGGERQRPEDNHATRRSSLRYMAQAAKNTTCHHATQHRECHLGACLHQEPPQCMGLWWTDGREKKWSSLTAAYCEAVVRSQPQLVLRVLSGSEARQAA